MKVKALRSDRQHRRPEGRTISRVTKRALRSSQARRPWWSILVAVAVLASGCASSVPYVFTEDASEKKPLSEVALIMEGGSGPATVLVVKEPGRDQRGGLRYYGRHQGAAGIFVALTPGQQTLWVNVRLWKVPNKTLAHEFGPYEVRFVAEKGHLYVFTAEQEGDTWHPVLTDKTSGRRVHP